MTVSLLAWKHTSDVLSSSGKGGRGKETITPWKRLCKVLFREQEQRAMAFLFEECRCMGSNVCNCAVAVWRLKICRRGGRSSKYSSSDDKLQ
mmetsp:Transcript_18726/g.40562  ORF Transcript_18726/g.40562 Transcript_18726/m.40562 type:complete len:92 (-) Transcript_18726:168-443(-)